MSETPTPNLFFALWLKDHRGMVELALQAKSFEEFQQSLATTFLAGLEEQHFMLAMRHVAPTIHQNFRGEPLVIERLEEPIAEFETLIQEVRRLVPNPPTKESKK